VIGEGALELRPDIAWLWADAVRADPQAPRAHPGVAWLIAMRGSGVSAERLFELFDVQPDDNPVAGGIELLFERRLEVGTTYRVRCSVADVQRKHGARIGAFDVVTCAYELSDDRGLAATVRNGYIFPRSRQS
jgi:hypothetical protein